MQKSRLKFLVMCFFTVVLFWITCSSNSVCADTYFYVRANATRANDGSDWQNAFSCLPPKLVRGATYYIADGSYPSYTFNTQDNGDQLITIKKATVADHGTSNGWSDTYGDGQAVFADHISFSSDYWVFDGNGSHTIPSDNTDDYGFKINSDEIANIGGIVSFGDYSGAVHDITFKYVHVYNAYNGSVNCGTVGLRFYPSQAQSYIKIQNCFLENSGKDGIQINSSHHILVERCYIKRYGKLAAEDPDYHGQTVQIFTGGSNIIFRYNVWEACEGQGLIQVAGKYNPSENIRFYGNVVFMAYDKSPSTPGFNSSGGIFGNAWNYNELSHIYIYNNTFVNIGGDYGGVAVLRNAGPGSDWNTYNNLYYNCESTSVIGFNNNGYHATGGRDSPGGTALQTNIDLSIFKDYMENDFRLTYATIPGLDLTTKHWWVRSPDPFFVDIDSQEDMYGNVRGSDGAWDRGAFEFVVSEIPESPMNLRLAH